MKFTPTIEPLPSRQLPSTLLWDLDTGSGNTPLWQGYGLPTRQLGTYMAGEIDFRTPVPTFPGFVDYSGIGGHGTIMSALYADETLRVGGTPIVMACVVGNGALMSTDAIGRAELTIAAVARSNPGVTNVVALPVGWGAVGYTEFLGRRALAAAHVPLIESAGNQHMDVSRIDFGPATIVVSAVTPAGILEPYSNYGRQTIAVVIPDPALGTSGAALIKAAHGY